MKARWHVKDKEAKEWTSNNRFEHLKMHCSHSFEVVERPLLVCNAEHQPFAADLLPPEHVQRLLSSLEECLAFDDAGSDGLDGSFGEEGGKDVREEVLGEVGVLWSQLRQPGAKKMDIGGRART